MAHTCPDCGSACYCGGDIDDIFFEDNDRCNHCLGKLDDDGDFDEPLDEEESIG